MTPNHKENFARDRSMSDNYTAQQIEHYHVAVINLNLEL